MLFKNLSWRKGVPNAASAPLALWFLCVGFVCPITKRITIIPLQLLTGIFADVPDIIN